MGQFSVFARGEIVGMARVGTPPSTIVKLVRKTNKKRATVRAVQQTIAKRKADAEWEGERKPGSGRPPVLSKKLANKIVKLVFKMRGKEVVTRAYCKNQIPELRKIGKNILSRALHAAGLAWLRRNRNRKVPVAALGPRRCYARWVLRQSVKVLKNFVYVDGTTFYLALNETGAEDQERQRLGQFVWRLCSKEDGLFQDTLSASLYAAKQGQPVKVWGMLANGHFSYWVLPASTGNSTVHMNGARYRTMLQKFAVKWVRAAWGGSKPRNLYYVQDHERCLWQSESLQVLRDLGFQVLDNYPVQSPDLNAIEQVWHRLRQILNESAPVGIEPRADFLVRLRRAANHLNTRHADELQRMCTNQQERARDLLKKNGGRTKW